MREPIIVFDFDKTLTYKDTLFGFYKAASRSRVLFNVKYPFFLVAAAAYKLGFISNSGLKKVGIWFYLKGKTREELEAIGKEYAAKIDLNKVYRDVFLNYSADQVLIISASFEEYLKPLFPQYRVTGSQLEYSEWGCVKGLDLNMFGEKKREWLEKNKICKIDMLYTDSFSDLPLMKMSNSTFLVSMDSIENIMDNKKKEL